MSTLSERIETAIEIGIRIVDKFEDDSQTAESLRCDLLALKDRKLDTDKLGKLIQMATHSRGFADLYVEDVTLGEWVGLLFEFGNALKQVLEDYVPTNE